MDIADEDKSSAWEEEGYRCWIAGRFGLMQDLLCTTMSSDECEKCIEEIITMYSECFFSHVSVSGDLVIKAAQEAYDLVDGKNQPRLSPEWITQENIYHKSGQKVTLIDKTQWREKRRLIVDQVPKYTLWLVDIVIAALHPNENDNGKAVIAKSMKRQHGICIGAACGKLRCEASRTNSDPDCCLCGDHYLIKIQNQLGLGSKDNKELKHQNTIIS